MKLGVELTGKHDIIRFCEDRVVFRKKQGICEAP